MQVIESTRTTLELYYSLYMDIIVWQKFKSTGKIPLPPLSVLICNSVALKCLRSFLFVTTLIKGGEEDGDILGLFQTFATYYIHDYTNTQISVRKILFIFAA